MSRIEWIRIHREKAVSVFDSVRDFGVRGTSRRMEQRGCTDLGIISHSDSDSIALVYAINVAEDAGCLGSVFKSLLERVAFVVIDKIGSCGMDLYHFLVEQPHALHE